MMDFQDLYRQLLLADPSVRKKWLLDQRPTAVSAARWWSALIDAAVSDVRQEQRGWPRTRPRADAELAASLVDWALEDNFPIEYAVNKLVELVRIALADGRSPDLLPANAQPDSVARQALKTFGFTRPRAVTRAAALRAKPVSDDDYVRPGEDVTESLRLLSLTEDYQEYHQLLGIQRMLSDLKTIMHLIADADLSAELAAWLDILPELDPVPADPAGPLDSVPPERC